MSAIGLFPPSIRRYLGDFVARSRRVRVARSGLIALALLLAWTLTVAAIDRFVPLSAWVRGMLLAAELFAAATIIFGPLREALLRRIDWVDASQQIERRNPSLGERLVTVTSQLLAPASYRGSPQILDALVQQVSDEVTASRRVRLTDWPALARPAVAALCLALATAGLWSLAWLNLPQLIDRQVRPFAGTLPVTTTQIDVTPSGASVREHEPLQIHASVRRMSDARPPMIHISTDARQWDAMPMTPASEHTYAYTTPPVEQDLRYYVTAGDATTTIFSARVLRRPAVAEFRIRYTYPAYTGRAPLSVRNTDGLIEAPQKSEAVVSVVATEPLASASLTIDGKPVEMTATTELNVRQVRLTVLKDQTCALELASDRGVEWRAPQAMHIRAVPDRAPLARIVQPATDLRLSAQEIVPLAYQALDDYGVAQLIARAQVNANPSVDYALRLRGDARRIEGAFELDLATLNVKVGDVVSITVVATDKPGQKGASDVRHILVSPRSIDVTTHQRLAELSQAADYAREWADQLAQAQRSVEQAKRAGADGQAEQSAAIARASRLLSAAEETGAMLRQSLLRAIVYSASPSMSDALAATVDATAVQLDAVDRVDETVASRRNVEDATAGRMSRTATAARELAAQIRKLADGDQAAAVLIDRANLKTAPTTAPTDRPAQERRRQMLDRARRDIDGALTALGIDPKDPAAVDAQLEQRIAVAAQIIAVAKPVDFTAAAQRWAAGIRGNEFQPPRLDERLAAASQAEAVRPNAELVAAHDLQYASGAAAMLAKPADPSAGAAGQQTRSEALDQFPAALAALRAEHEVNRRALRAATPADARQIHQVANAIHIAASAARKRMIAWAAMPGAAPDELAAKARDLEQLALSAGVATQNKEFDTAAELDRRLAASLNKPELADVSAAPRAIDKLSNSQERVADQTAGADDSQTAAIAGVQKQVADEIGHTQQGDVATGAQSTPDSADARQRATEAISQAQERLASLPMQLQTTQQLAVSLAEATARLVTARAEAADALPSRREALERVVGMVTSEVDEARTSFDDAVKPLRGRLADELIDTLRPFAPDTSGAVSAVEDQLRGALVDLQQTLFKSAETGDRAGVETAAQQARDALALVQDALREAQGKVIERDPLVSARWFARAAADALSAAPPNKRSAAAHQKKTLEALSRAALDALRRSKNARLSQVPGYAPFYVPSLPGAWADGDGHPPTDRLFQTIPGLREWGRLRERMGESLDAPVRESEPAGYSETLRLYFEVLGREDAKPREPAKP
jgi:hypothetical protein